MVEDRLPLAELILANVPRTNSLLSQKDIYGNSCLHLAALYQSAPMATLLLRHGAPTTAENSVEIAFCKHSR